MQKVEQKMRKTGRSLCRVLVGTPESGATGGAAWASRGWAWPSPGQEPPLKLGMRRLLPASLRASEGASTQIHPTLTHRRVHSGSTGSHRITEKQVTETTCAPLTLVWGTEVGWSAQKDQEESGTCAG
jgi:hypothetical protein